VTEICGKNGKTLLDILARAIPVQNGSDSESVAKIMQTRSMAVELTTQADLP